MQFPDIDFTAVYPEVIVTLVGLLVLVIDILVQPKKKASLSVIAGIGLASALVAVFAIWERNGTAFSGMVAVDPYAQFFKIIFIFSAIFTLFMSPRYLELNKIAAGSEYLVLILFCTLGMMVMVAANDLVTIYIGLELMAISIYLMAGFQRETPRSSEAAMKYFLLGAFASAILLYGMSLIYGITGTTNLVDIGRHLDIDTENTTMITLALVLMTVGFGFKIAAVPFHMWTPDVYEGAPTPLTAFMSVGPKVAAFAVIMRVYMISFDALVADWVKLFWLLSVLTMIVGNVIAVAQKSVKRMLAYSSIAHAGYLLIGVVSAGTAIEYNGARGAANAMESLSSVMIYLFAYMFMNLGTFAVVISLCRADDPCESLQDYAGLARRRPWTAALMTILLLSLAGFPPTFGFVGKLFIFKAAINSQNVPLAVIGVLASVVAAFYYIRVVLYMYMREPDGEFVVDTDKPSYAMLAVIMATIFTLWLGVAPGSIIAMARESIKLLL